VLLRSAKAQHVILETICSSIWQPIYSEALVNPNTQGLLNGIYSTLARRGTQWQSIWRLLSVESMDRLTNSRNSNVTSLAEDVLRKLEPLVPRQLEATLKEELEDILKDAAKVWSIAQKDRNLIEIDFVPNPDDGQGWVKDSILRDYVPELEEPLPNLVNSGHVFTFPKVIRYAYHKDPMAGGKSKGSPALVIHQGSAIFSNSDILREAAKECKDQEQEMINASIKATTKTRSPSTTLSQDPALLRERIRKNKANREPLQNGTQ
jgi:hypothetical protein